MEERLRPQQDLESKNGFPDPIRVKCFKCQKQFWIKFVVPQQNYSRKNDWEYWTGESGQKKICNSCLRSLYYNKPAYWKTIRDLKKRANLAGYISNNFV